MVALTGIDDALVQLRRLWSSDRQTVVDDRGRVVEMSSVLVVEACARVGEAGGGTPSVGDVARFADVAHSTASRLVERAVRAGLVRRTDAGDDARRTTLALTADGLALRSRAVAFRLAWLGTVLAEWPPADVEAFAGLLARFAAGVGALGPPAAVPAHVVVVAKTDSSIG